jgi:hypothetical protein
MGVGKDTMHNVFKKYWWVIVAAILATVAIPMIPSGRDSDEDVILTPCEAILDDSQLTPQDGQTLQLGTSVDLAWVFLPSGVATTPNIRWSVDLYPPGGVSLTQETDQMWLPLSAFSVAQEIGLYRWRVSAEYESTPSVWRTFCVTSVWFSFRLEAPSASPTVTTTATPPAISTPTLTSTATVTPSPTPMDICKDPVIVMASENLNCRQGSDVSFKIVGTLMQGESIEVMAVNPSQTWAYVPNPSFPDAGLSCWLWLGSTETATGDLSCSAIRADPSTPAPTDTVVPPTCQPDLSREACEAAGGRWEVLPDGISCICP